jgi:chemotaxis protein methyltransferase CheR
LTRIAQDTAYNRLKNQLIVATGLAFYADRDELLSELIAGRLSELRLPDCSAYLQLLAKGEEGNAEMELLVAKLTIGETYFFRDEGQFAALRDVVIPNILEHNRHSKQLRIWSAGCSTGAEPYSLAILLSQFADQIAGWQISICASDLNRRYLAQAAEGRFRPWALRSTSDAMKRECFTKQGQMWTIQPRYKQWISFHHMNLVGSEFNMPDIENAHFDLILCRNVMIYFAPEVNRHLIAHFHRSLEDGGWLVVGASEYNLEFYTAFRTVNVTDAKLYQKMALEPLSLVPLRTLLPVKQLIPAKALHPDLTGLRKLLDHGAWQDAADYSHDLLKQDRLNPAIYFYQALIFENLGLQGEAARSLRHAIYLDRKFALAHFHLGLALQRDHRAGDAARCFGNTLQVLADTPEETAVTAGAGLTVTELRQLAKMRLEHSREAANV